MGCGPSAPNKTHIASENQSKQPAHSVSENKSQVTTSKDKNTTIRCTTYEDILNGQPANKQQVYRPPNPKLQQPPLQVHSNSMTAQQPFNFKLSEIEREFLSECYEYTKYAEVDKQSLRARQCASVQDQAKLLTANRKTQAEKVRSIWIWLAANISFEGEVSSQAALATELQELQQIEETFKKKKATSLGYSTLFKDKQQQLYLTGIQALILKGYPYDLFKCDQFYKGLQSDKRFHIVKENDVFKQQPFYFWNALEIDNLWLFVDVTAAASLNNADENQQAFITIEQIIDFSNWLLPVQVGLQALGHPCLQNNKLEYLPMLKEKITSKTTQQYVESVRYEKAFYAFGLSSLEAQPFYQTSDDGSISFLLKLDRSDSTTQTYLDINVKFYRYIIDDQTQNKPDYAEFNGATYHYAQREGNIFQVVVRFPDKGLFRVKVFGSLLNKQLINDEEYECNASDSHQLFQMLVECKTSIGQQESTFVKVAKAAYFCQIQLFETAGFIKCQDQEYQGLAIKVALKNQINLALFDDETGETVQQATYLDIQNDLVIATIRFPQKGKRYSATYYARSQTLSEWEFVCSYTLQAESVFEFPQSKIFPEVWDGARKYGLSLLDNYGDIVSTSGEFKGFRILGATSNDITLTMTDENEDEIDQSTYLTIEGNTVIANVRFPQINTNYSLYYAARPKFISNNEQGWTTAFRYQAKALIQCPNKFPLVYEAFQKHLCCLIDLDGVLETQSGLFENSFKISYSGGNQLALNLYEDAEHQLEVKRCTLLSANSDNFSASVVLPLPQKTYYLAYFLIENETQNDLQILCQYQLKSNSKTVSDKRYPWFDLSACQEAGFVPKSHINIGRILIQQEKQVWMEFQAHSKSQLYAQLTDLKDNNTQTQWSVLQTADESGKIGFFVDVPAIGEFELKLLLMQANSQWKLVASYEIFKQTS